MPNLYVLLGTSCIKDMRRRRPYCSRKKKRRTMKKKKEGRMEKGKEQHQPVIPADQAGQTGSPADASQECKRRPGGRAGCTGHSTRYDRARLQRTRSSGRYDRPGGPV
jgi:hypothetical protein